MPMPSLRGRGKIAVSPDVDRQLHPRTDSAHSSGGLSLHRRLRAGQSDPVLDLDAARLARHFADDMVRAVLPRSGARDARTGRHRGGAGRWSNLDVDAGVATG